MKKVLFVGGDKRSLIAMDILKNNGYSVCSFGLSSSDFEYIKDFDIIVLGIPTTRDGLTVNCPLSGRNILLSEVEKSIGEKQVISAGYRFNTKNNTDILSLDSYALLNAVPTAEGAISFAIENTDFTLWKSKILIIGNGRVGKILASRLKYFGCDLTVSARKESDFALLEAQNIKYMKTEKVNECLENFDIVFSTVDHEIIKNLYPLEKTLLIDLSSKGCIDYDMAKSENIKAYKLPAIPSKTAPQSAGKIFAQTIMSIIENQNQFDGKEML